jgi:hypothetical protein
MSMPPMVKSSKAVKLLVVQVIIHQVLYAKGQVNAQWANDHCMAKQTNQA